MMKGNPKEPAAPPAADPPNTTSATLARTGDYWTITCGASSFSIRDVKGLSYLQRLLQNPGHEFHVLELASESAPHPSEDSERNVDADLLSAPHMSIREVGDSGEMLDDQARRNYARRLIELRGELEDFRERGDTEGAARAQEDIDFLMHEISRAVGLGGRARRAGSTSERARLNVKRAINAALQKISEYDSALGALLDRVIVTGTFCLYRPGVRDPIVWRFAEPPPAGVAPAADAKGLEPLRAAPGFLHEQALRTSLVGRSQEYAFLCTCLQNSAAGKGQIAMIGGALGVGKTRISLEMMAAASERGFVTLAGSCFEGANPDPFNPFIEAIERALAHARSPEMFRQTLGKDAPDLARLMPQLRRVFPDIPREEQLSPEQARRAMFNAVLNLLLRISATAPVLLLLEDLHWADEGSLSLLNHLGRSLAQAPIMILGTLRDSKRDLAAPLGRTIDELTRLHLLQRINLGGLSRAAVGEMLQSLAGHSPPESLVNLFYETTEGNPFFVEELFADLAQRKKLFDSDGAFLKEIVISDTEVPQSLRLVIGRRLSALSADTRNLLSAASVIGRSFTLEELESLTGEEAERLIDRVEEAEGNGTISSTLEDHQVRFQFSHQLIQNTVLAEVSTVRRQRLHAKYAGALEMHTADPEAKAAEIAHHLVQAGAAAEPNKTVNYLTLAARRAVTQSAFDTALSHLDSARAATRRLAPSRERDERELALYFQYFPVVSMLNRWTGSEAGGIYARARELSQQLGQNDQMYALLEGSALFHWGRGELDRAELYVQQMLQFAATSAQPRWSAVAQGVLGYVLCCRGQFVSAHEQLTGAMRLRDSIAKTEPPGQRGKIVALGIDAMVLWMLGYAQQALSAGEEAIRIASEAKNLPDLVLAFTYAHIVAMLARQYSRALDLADHAVTLAARTKFEYLQIAMAWSRDACRVLARVDQNIDAVRGDFERHFAAEAQLHRPRNCTVLAECCGVVGQAEAGLAMIEEAFKCADATGQRMSDADTWRVRGVLLLELAARAETATAESLTREAEECFLQGIEIARRQQARSWELRTILSLSRLLIRSGRDKQARDMLSAAYSWFTEGFEFPDLLEAAQLLRELQPSPSVNRAP